MCLDHVMDHDGFKRVKKPIVPSREDMRADALMGQITHISCSTKKKDVDTPLILAITLSNEHATCNEVHKVASDANIDIGTKRLNINKQFLARKELEAKARGIEVQAHHRVSSAHLNQLHCNLRQEF